MKTMISKEVKTHIILKEKKYNKSSAKVVSVGDTVYVTGYDYDNFFYIEKGIVKKIRYEDEVGIEFENPVGGGHTLDGCARDYHGYWINLGNDKFLIATRNMEEFYSYYRVEA
jgi:hypothetical protein